MTHLLVHLVKEIDILGPVFLHNMFPFERFMGVLKKCVRNRARLEGSISSAYGTEVIDFCVDFIDDLKLIGVPESRYEGRLTGKGTLGKKSYVSTDESVYYICTVLLIFHVLESVSIIIYKSNDNSNTFIIYIYCTIILYVLYIYIIFL